MAYDFDGTDDKVAFGSDVSIDQFTSKTICCWFVNDNATSAHALLTKAAINTAWLFRTQVTTPKLQFQHGWTTTNGGWVGGTATTNGTMYHAAVTYDNTSSTNDPIIYLDGVAESLTESPSPGGSANDDSAQTLQAGLDSGSTNDMDGRISHMVYDNTLWSAADINRARYWGHRGGAVQCYWPLLTDAVNRGTATANGTATGATLSNLPRVERCWAGTMGVGR